MENQLTPNNSMVLEIRELLENARKNVAQQVNTQLLTTYWNIGRIIVEYEQQNQIRADYGKQTLRELSKELTREFGKVSLALICKICVSFIWPMKNARQCLANCPGLITVNF